MLTYKKTIPDLTDSDIKRFWSKVRKTPTCWLWTAHTLNGGHGVFVLNHDHFLAHRVSAKLAGILIPRLHVCHKCVIIHRVFVRRTYFLVAIKTMHVTVPRKDVWGYLPNRKIIPT